MTHRRSCVAIALAVLVIPAATRAAEPDRILFDHPRHAEQGIECATCHAGVETWSSSADVVRPGHDVCQDCHDVESTGECGTCHRDPENPGPPARAVVGEKFSHHAHIAQGMACADCHGDATGSPRLPAKAQCRACHETAPGLNDCRFCHGPEESLRPLSHVPGYLSLHGADAHADQAACENCHAQVDCQDCHSGDNVRPRSHGLQFAFEHALEARGHEADCATCHEEPGFCSSCHLAERVFPRSHSRGDWLVLAPDGGRHAEEARLDFESCIACHDTGTGDPVCADCHGR